MRVGASSTSFTEPWRAFALFAGGYALADAILNRIAFSEGWTILWPLNGLSVAFLISRPKHMWPRIVIAIQAGSAVGELLDGNSIISELVLRTCSATELLICAWILPPFNDLSSWLKSPKFHRRLLSALSIGPAVSGLAAAAYTCTTTRQPFAAAFNDWAIADALGILVAMPFALACTSEQMRAGLTPQRLTHFLMALLFSFAVSAVAFSTDAYPLLFLVYPALLFTDLLLGIEGSSTALLGASLIAVYCATHHHGPFGAWSSALAISRDHALQIFIGFMPCFFCRHPFGSWSIAAFLLS